MIDDIQVPKHFEGTYKEFHLYMRIVPDTKKLDIKVQNTMTFDQYHLLVDEDYVNQQKDFKNIFEEPLDILGYCILHFHDVTIDQQAIKIKYEFGSFRKNVKYFAFNLKKVEMDPLQHADLKIQKMKQQFATELAAKEKKNVQLQRQLKIKTQKFRKAIIVYAQKNRQMFRIIQKLQEQIKIMQQKQAKSKQQDQIRQYLDHQINMVEPKSRNRSKKNKMHIWKKIGEILPGDENLKIIGKVISSLQNQNSTWCFVILGDQTGTIKAVLPSKIYVLVNHVYTFTNIDAAVRNKHIRLQLKSSGNAYGIQMQIQKVNLSNNISQKEWIQQV